MISIRKRLRSVFCILILYDIVSFLKPSFYKEAYVQRNVNDGNNGVDLGDLQRINLIRDGINVNQRDEIGSNIDIDDAYKHQDNDTQEHNDTIAAKSKYSFVIRLYKLMDQYNKVYNHSMFRRIPNIEIFYISAIVSNNFDLGTYITVIGWQAREHKHDDVFCCVRFQNTHSVFQVVKRNTIDISHIRLIKATQFICPVNSSYAQASNITVGLAMSEEMCMEANYIDADNEEIPRSEDNLSLGICGKILYGDFPAERVLEWLEINRILGVDKVILYTFNITREMEAVLQYYVNEGFLVTKKFDFPAKYKYPRFLGQKYMMAYMDEQVVVYDCLERLKRFKFFTIMDVDEFLMPRLGADNYKLFLRKLTNKYPRAAGFTLQTCVFIMDWDKTNPSSDIVVEQYTLRRTATWDRKKSILRTDRVDLSSVWTHDYKSLNMFKYNKVKLQTNVAVLYHYRQCRSEWWRNGTCLTSRDQHNDNAMKRIITNYGDQIRKVRNAIL